MDTQTVIGIVVALIVTILGFAYRYYKPLDPAKSWLELLLSVIGAIVIAFALGKIPAFVGFKDPIATLQWLGVATAAVFAFVEIVYNAVKQAFPNSTLVVKTFKSLRF